ncbi:MAG: helix-turn-helix domain-containing protein [Ruminococcaceae bacterium]|nr:helix-turn-helix domain-containing protein [Oscillospiraceae bacterium]
MFEYEDNSRLLEKNNRPKGAPVYHNIDTTSSIYEPEFALSQLHFHEFVEISIVTAGSGIHSCLNEQSECNTGDVYIVNAGVPHSFFAKSENERPTVCNILFDPSALLDADIISPDSQRYCHGIFKDNALIAYVMLTQYTLEEVKRICLSIGSEIEKKQDEWESAVRAHLTTLLILLKRYANDRKTTIVAESVRSKDRIMVFQAMRIAMDNYRCKDISLEKIASDLYISKSYLSRIFKKVTGEHFSDYVRSVRLKQACRLLRDTSLTIEQIVHECGLKDVPSFYQLFKSHTLMTPYQYRTSERENGIPPEPKNENINYLKGKEIMTILKEISENLQIGKAKIVKELVQNAIDEKIPAEQILNEGLLAGMSVIGEKFKNNEIYVPEVLLAARAMSMGAQLLKPLLASEGIETAGKVCIGTVQGDLHDIGKNLVKMMMEGKGLEVIDLGTDVAPETFIKTAIEEDCQVICCSALLTTTMGVMEDVVKKATEAGIRDKVKIMIGGAPITEEFCQKIGADRYTFDAASAADVAVELCSQN